MGFLSGIGGELTGLFGGKPAKSESSYSVTTPKPMQQLWYGKNLDRQFLQDYYGLSQADMQKRAALGQTAKSREAAYAAAKANLDNAIRSGASDAKISSLQNQADRALSSYNAAKARADVYAAPSPYQKAMDEYYGGIRGAGEDIAKYQEQQAGLVPTAMRGASTTFRNLLDQIAQAGIEGTGFGGDRAIMEMLAQPTTAEPIRVGFGGESFSFLPKGAYDAMAARAAAIPEIMGQRSGAMELLARLGQLGYASDVAPSEAQYEYGLRPLITRGTIAEQAPTSAGILDYLTNLQNQTQGFDKYRYGLGASTPIQKGSSSSVGPTEGWFNQFGRGFKDIGAGVQGIGSGFGNLMGGGSIMDLFA